MREIRRYTVALLDNGTIKEIERPSGPYYKAREVDALLREVVAAITAAFQHDASEGTLERLAEARDRLQAVLGDIEPRS